MKILFLGTSAGWPLPRLGCSCSVCVSPDPKDKRLRPALLVNDTLLIDAGPDIYHQLTKYQIDSHQFEALILTHAHPDHLLGFYDLTHLYQLQTEKPQLVAAQPTINGLRQTHHYPLNPFKLKIVKPNETICLNTVEIQLIPVPHSKAPCFGVKMKEKGIFIYLPDLRRLPKTQRRTFRGVDLLVFDGSSLGRRGQTKIHQSIEEGIKLAKNLKPKKVYFTHLGHLTGRHAALENFVQKNGGPSFHIAYDGLKLVI